MYNVPLSAAPARGRALVGAAALAVLTACGGGGGGAAPAPATPAPAVTVMPVLAGPAVALGSGATIGTVTWPDGNAAAGGHGATVGGVNCLVTEEYHIHAHLSILKDGQALAVPARIGLDGCAYELHTHDASGVIHVETSAYRPFTLGQFFAVWGQPLTTSNVAGITGLPVKVYTSDGSSVSEYTGDPASLVMSNHQAITIVLGAVPKQLPTYTWGAGL
jgi:hypothetical protein